MSLGQKLLAFVALLILGFPVGLLGAHVATELWSWFVVPYGLRPVGLWQMCGFLTLISLTRTALAVSVAQLDTAEGGEVYQRAFISLLTCVILYLTSWGFGAIYHALMVAG